MSMKSVFRDARNASALMRPGVVWFGEQLSRNELERVEDFLDGGACDVVIVAGTTATFGYIIDWALRGSRDGAELIEVNPEETPLSRFATRLVREPAAIALPRIVDELIGNERRCYLGSTRCQRVVRGSLPRTGRQNRGQHAFGKLPNATGQRPVLPGTDVLRLGLFCTLIQRR